MRRHLVSTPKMLKTAGKGVGGSGHVEALAVLNAALLRRKPHCKAPHLLRLHIPDTEDVSRVAIVRLPRRRHGINASTNVSGAFVSGIFASVHGCIPAMGQDGAAKGKREAEVPGWDRSSQW